MEVLMYTANIEMEHKKKEMCQLEESKVGPSSLALIRWVRFQDSVVFVALTTQYSLLAAMAMNQK